MAFDTLQLLAAKFSLDGHPLQAIKCLEASLSLSPMPADAAQVRLRAARLLLQHTTNLAEAKQHLQKAQLLVQKLPSHHILKCEVAALLGKAHKYCGEVDFQKGAYAKGLDVCSQALSGAGAGDSASRAQLQRWACYFHLRIADALASQADSQGAAAAAERGLGVARSAGLAVEELVVRLFQMQLCMVAWDRPATDGVITAVGEALQAGGEEVHDSPAVQQVKLHFNILQIIYAIRLGQYDQLVKLPEPLKGSAPSNPSASTPVAITTLLELLGAVAASGGAAAYEWLPLEAQEGLVRLLASTILRGPGKVKPALAHVSQGLTAVDEGLRRLGVAATRGGGGPGGGDSSGGGGGRPATEQEVHHADVWVARALLVLRLLLVESRLQLHLLQSDYASARGDVAENAELHGRFPLLLEALRPSLHMQAALYAHAVGAWGAAVAHYAAAAGATTDPLAEPQARCLAAMARVAQGGPDAAGEAMTLLGDLYGAPAQRVADCCERALAQAAGALLRLGAGGGDDPQDEARAAEAKVMLGKALKSAHERLHSHQLVTQLLNTLAPLRLDTSDVSGATQMLTSSFTLARAMGDLNGQVAALGVLQQVHIATHQADEAAQTSNYLARKKADLAARLAAAEADAAEHAAVLSWGL